MAGLTIEVAPPVRTKRSGGLSTVATFRPNERLGVVSALVFQSDGCTFPRPEVSRCIAATPPADKTFDGIEIEGAIGAPFTLYAGVACYAGPDPDFLERARRILGDGQDRALENVLETWAADATALTPGPGAAGAVAAVEQELDENYLGQGVILMSRADAILADAEGVVHRVGETIETITGTPVIASGVVTPGTVYGLGAITVESSDVVESDIVSPTENTNYALAEASYAVLVDCEFRTKAAIQPGGGDMAVGVENVVDNEDGTFSLLLTDGTTTDPIELLPGTPGAPGADGAAATIAVGTVTTGAPGSEATVTNSGTASAAVFDIAIPAGQPGADGSDGVVQSVVAGDGVTVDDTDPANPIIATA